VQYSIVYHYNGAQWIVLLVASWYALPGYSDRHGLGSGLDHLCHVLAAYALRLNSRAGTEGSTLSSLNCDRWLILCLEVLSH